jgi:hypothetical protein
MVFVSCDQVMRDCAGLCLLFILQQRAAMHGLLVHVRYM